MTFKLTYSTMFDPPEEMHERFEGALAKVREGLGVCHPNFIGGRNVMGKSHTTLHSPADQRQVLGHFARGTAEDAAAAMAAAKEAFPDWRATPPRDRIRLVRRVGELLEERAYDIGAAMALEVGKNRMEALGEAQETADFFSGYAREYEVRGFYELNNPDDPLVGFRSHNRSVLKPYGPWVVIAPFNFPLALAGGPTAAALVTGNTVVLKGASVTPWSGRLLADCIQDAGLPPGVFNYVMGSGEVVGEALIQHSDRAGITFTGSQQVGMRIVRLMAAGEYPRPCIAEMGGKNPCIVTAKGDLQRAATGIIRSAFGMGGQKCSALSRVYVEEAVAEDLIASLRERIRAIKVGDPCRRENWLGPVITQAAVREFEAYCERLKSGGARILEGGGRLLDGALVRGHFVAPTLAEAPAEHPLFREEMFLPILMVCRVKDLDEALRHSNDVALGLTAGFYGDDQEMKTFLERIEAGVLYLNRPQGATTGAWPGYQAFGGWKGSGSTGKAIGSAYYLPQYLREQSHTWVE